MPFKATGYDDSAVWDTKMIDYFSQRDDIDLYVVSGHAGMIKKKEEFELNGVRYTFLRYEYSSILKRFIRDNIKRRKIDPFVNCVKKISRSINPDLILLVGAENAGYSSSILEIKDYPVYVLCQTIYNNPERSLLGGIDQVNQEVELEIFHKLHYFGVYCRMHYELLHSFNPDASIFKFDFPSSEEILSINETEKEYDFVNFAKSMSFKKGFHDSIKALSIIKKKFPNVKLNLIGNSTVSEKKELDALVQDLHVEDNVVFTQPFERQSDLFNHVQKSRFALLPCMMDNISSTMNQAMQLQLPLIVYETPGTPSFNRQKECVLIAKKGSVEELASCMLSLLGNTDLENKLRNNALEYQVIKAENARHNGERLVDNFYAIIEKENKDIPIPENQLFNPIVDD
jgi:glycosyltransferase involved in cell wall biosynthesis